MDMILLTKSSVPIIGQVASIMGWIMDGIYRVLDLVGIQNLGLCIIIFSIIIYALMTPLQVKHARCKGRLHRPVPQRGDPAARGILLQAAPGYRRA